MTWRRLLDGERKGTGLIRPHEKKKEAIAYCTLSNMWNVKSNLTGIFKSKLSPLFLLLDIEVVEWPTAIQLLLLFFFYIPFNLIFLLYIIIFKVFDRSLNQHVIVLIRHVIHTPTLIPFHTLFYQQPTHLATSWLSLPLQFPLHSSSSLSF